MFCSNCGAEVLDTHTFCPSCGSQVKPHRISSNSDDESLFVLDRRLSELEARLPKSLVLSKKFWPRALAVYGHAFAGGLPFLILPLFILIAATIAIPSLLRSRQATHEAAAVSSLRTLSTAEVTYLTTNGRGTFGTMSDLVNSQLISSAFNSGPVSGYNFALTLNEKRTDFIITANPASTNEARYGYFITPEGTVRYSTTIQFAPAGSAGSPVSR